MPNHVFRMPSVVGSVPIPEPLTMTDLPAHTLQLFQLRVRVRVAAFGRLRFWLVDCVGCVVIWLWWLCC